MLIDGKYFKSRSIVDQCVQKLKTDFPESDYLVQAIDMETVPFFEPVTEKTCILVSYQSSQFEITGLKSKHSQGETLINVYVISKRQIDQWYSAEVLDDMDRVKLSLSNFSPSPQSQDVGKLYCTGDAPVSRGRIQNLDQKTSFIHQVQFQLKNTQNWGLK